MVMMENRLGRLLATRAQDIRREAILAASESNTEETDGYQEMVRKYNEESAAIEMLRNLRGR